MAKMRLLAFAFVVITTGSAILVGCDNRDLSADVESLLADARLARQTGDIELAVDLLETAHAHEPGHAAVRVELGSAYLEREDVDLFDVDRIALFLTTFEDPATDPEPASSVGATCAYADDPDAQPFEPGDYQEYFELLANRDLIETVASLLSTSAEGTLIPVQVRDLDLCVDIVDAALTYDRAQALESMRGTGLNDNEIATALAVNAVVHFLEAYFFITEDLPQQTTWYRIRGENGDLIGACADDPDALREQVERAVQDVAESVASLDLRDHVLGGGTASGELLDHVLDVYEAIGEDLAPLCEGA